MSIQEVQLKECYWQEDEEVLSYPANFHYEEAKTIGKEKYIRKFSAKQIDDILL